MPLNKQKLNFNFVKGVDSKQADQVMTDGSLLELQNMRFAKKGALNKRNGTVKLSKRDNLGNTITNNKLITNYGTNLVQIANNNLYVYNETADHWLNKGVVGSIQVDYKNVIRNNYVQSNPDMAVSNQTALFTWEDGRGGVRYSVVDVNTGATFLNDILIDVNGEKPKALSCGDNLYVFYVVTDDLYSVRINSKTLQAYSAAKIVDMNATNNCYDVCVIGNNMLFTYADVTGQQIVGYLKQNLTVGSPSISLSNPKAINHTPTSNLAVCVVGNYIYCAGVGNKKIEMTKLSTTFVILSDIMNVAPFITIAASTEIANITICKSDSSTKLIDLYYDVIDPVTPTLSLVNKSGMLTTKAADGITELKRTVSIAGKANIHNGTVYLPVVFASEEQATYFLLNSSGGIVAKWLNLLGGSYRDSCVTNESSIVNNIMYIASQKKGRLLSESGSLFSRLGVVGVNINLSNTNIPSTTSLGGNLYIASSFVNLFDGVNITESNFHIYPENVTTTQSTAGYIADGTYQYQVVYSWMASNGDVHTSAPSLPITQEVVDGSGTAKVVLTIPTLHLTNKSNVIIDIYRTEANGLLFYKVTSTSSPTANDTTVNTITFNDTISDTDLISNQLLYTTGGIFENYGSPSCTIVTSFQNRLFTAGTEDKTKIYYSKKLEAENGLGFSELLTINTNSDDGDITGLMKLDDKLIIFKERGLYYVSGEGFNNAGGGNGYSEAINIYGHGGCIDRGSIVSSPNGIFYKSQTGIYLLDRGLQTAYIGSPVYRYNEFNVIKADIVESTDEVRFVLSDGNVLNYSNEFGQWSVFDYGGGSLFSCGVDGNYYVLSDDNVVYKEIEGVYDDAKIGINQKIVTQWFSFDGIQGYQRVYRIGLLGKFKSDHTLRVKIAYDFREFYQDTFIIRAGEIIDMDVFGGGIVFGDGGTFGGTEDAVYQFEVSPRIQKCTSLKVLIEDVSPSAESFELSNIAFMVGLKTDLNKLKVGKTT